jgi:hypothetical protein
MFSQAKWVYERMKLYKLMTLQPSWSSRQYTSVLGLDHKWVQKWKKRLDDVKEVTVKSFQSLSHAPKQPPLQIPHQAKEIVCQLREELSKKLHRPAGAKTILYALQKYHESQKSAFRFPTALSSINKILRERGYIQPKQKRFRESP